MLELNLGIIGLIFSVLFSASEIALISATKLQIDVWVKQRYKLGRLAKFIIDYRSAGCNLLRFSFAQTPKGKESEILDTVPTERERSKFIIELEELIKLEDRNNCRVLLIDSDKVLSIRSFFFFKPLTSSELKLSCILINIFLKTSMSSSALYI